MCLKLLGNGHWSISIRQNKKRQSHTTYLLEQVFNGFPFLRILHVVRYATCLWIIRCWYRIIVLLARNLTSCKLALPSKTPKSSRYIQKIMRVPLIFVVHLSQVFAGNKTARMLNPIQIFSFPNDPCTGSSTSYVL